MSSYRGCALFLSCVLFMAAGARAEPGLVKAASGEVELLQSGPDRAWCPLCGMDLKLFYKTSHALELDAGIWRQYCSIHCLAKDMTRMALEGSPNVRVVDAASEKWIDARQAIYIADSRIPGTMSRMSKIAFATEKDAQAFQKRFGGRRTNFDGALRLARAQLAADGKRLLAMKKLKMIPAGKKLYARHCPDRPKAQGSLAQIKTRLLRSGACPGLMGKKLQAVALYLHARQHKKVDGKAIPVPPKSKCPVCGMFVAKYPDWVAVARDGKNQPHYFDGAKDLFKFILAPGRWGAAPGTRFQAIQVTHYYSRGALDARKAVFVIGSDVLGPMGHELIPLADEEEARLFLREHHGEKILRFEQVDLELLRELDQRK